MRVEINFIHVEDSIGVVGMWTWRIRGPNQKILAQAPAHYRSLSEVSRCLRALLRGGPHENAVESALQEARLKTKLSCRGKPQH